MNARLHRRSIRLRDYDYAQSGAYFVTICTHTKLPLFGQVVGEEMVVNEYGRIVQQEWEATAVQRPYVELDAFVVMPNHIHGIIMIMEDSRGLARQTPTQPQFTKPVAASLGTIIGAFKSSVTRRIRQQLAPDAIVWQRNYYEHIIRDEGSLNTRREYITYNPARWACDELFS